MPCQHLATFFLSLKSSFELTRSKWIDSPDEILFGMNMRNICEYVCRHIPLHYETAINYVPIYLCFVFGAELIYGVDSGVTMKCSCADFWLASRSALNKRQTIASARVVHTDNRWFTFLNEFIMQRTASKYDSIEWRRRWGPKSKFVKRNAFGLEMLRFTADKW